VEIVKLRPATMAQQASRGHESSPPTLDVYPEIFSPGMRFVGNEYSDTVRPRAMTLL
jgi:hypothetical protein